jgi:integral membrane sensor domain MASE1
MNFIPEWLTSFAAGALTWVAGETGRAMVAGAAGGLLRWFGQEKRRLRDGIIAVASGALAALYLAPVILAILAAFGLHLGDGPDVDRAAGFLAGLSGMSIAKVIIAMVEAWAERAKGNDNERS